METIERLFSLSDQLAEADRDTIASLTLKEGIDEPNRASSLKLRYL